MLEVELNKAYSPFPKREISSKIEKFCQVCGESSSRVKEINVFPDFFNNNDLNLFSLNSFYLCPKCKKKLEKIILYTENQILYHHKNIYLFVNKHFLSENYNKEDIISIETAERINISFVPNNVIKQRRSKKKNNYEKAFDIVDSFKVLPNKENNEYLASQGSAAIYETYSLSELIKRPELGKEQIIHFIGDVFDQDTLEQVEIHVKYEGYIQKAQREADKVLRLEDKLIPDVIDYRQIRNISSESREKLMKIRPKTLGQASRISGVNPADISVLLVYLESGAFNHGI